jgi:tetratricopeptide (TPR) repeat protein
MIDADEILKFDEGFDPIKFKSTLNCDLYDVTTKMGGMSYFRPQLSSNKCDFRYEGVVHEFLTGKFSTRGTAEGFYNIPIQDSNRNRSGNKFEKDVELLKEAIDQTTDDWFKSRYTFYLAQSYRDLGKREESLEYYLKRTEMGFWEEEIFISYYNAANIMKELNYSDKDVIQTFMKGHEASPKRIECLYGATNYCRIKGINQQGYIIGKSAIEIKKPDSSLFSEEWMYDYGILDEFSIVAYWSGHFIDSKLACEKLLSEKKYPEYYHDRINSNLKFSLDVLK